MMKSRLPICLLLCVFLLGCAHLPWRRAPKDDPRTRGEEGIDPLGYPQDQIIVTQEEPGQKPAKTGESFGERGYRLEPTPGPDSLPAQKMYRIQFFATKYPDEASQVAEMVSGMVSEKTYIEYKTPYYWVRAGDCSTREEADLLLRKIKRLGYTESWVVEVEPEY